MKQNEPLAQTRIYVERANAQAFGGAELSTRARIKAVLAEPKARFAASDEACRKTAATGTIAEYKTALEQREQARKQYHEAIASAVAL